MKISTTKFARVLVAGLVVTVQMTNGAVADGLSYQTGGFKEIKIAPGLAQADHVIDTVRPFLLDHPESLEGKASVDLTVRKKANGFVVNIIKKGFLDDSVLGEHYRGFVIRSSKGKWQLVSMGVKYSCYRGKSSGGLCL